jgi:hypothetical protein
MEELMIGGSLYSSAIFIEDLHLGQKTGIFEDARTGNRKRQSLLIHSKIMKSADIIKPKNKLD